MQSFLLPSPFSPLWRTHINVPYGSAVVKKGVELPDVPDVAEVPRIQAVVIVHTGQLQ